MAEDFDAELRNPPPGLTEKEQLYRGAEINARALAENYRKKFWGATAVAAVLGVALLVRK